jgi:hypothetical protein
MNANLVALRPAIIAFRYFEQLFKAGELRFIQREIVLVPKLLTQG